MKKWPIPTQSTVSLYAINLDEERPFSYLPILADEERERADRFHFDHDRHRYIVARGRLRQLLGQHLDLAPEAVKLAYTTYGKPYLPHQPDLHFNVSHSQQFGLLALAWGQRLGVDIEVIRPLTDMSALVHRFFAPAEISVWQSLLAQQQADAFFCCWTRKEAFIKAIGEGLSYPLDQFEVSLHPDEPARLLTIQGSPTAAQQWEMVSIRPFPQTVAALLVEAKNKDSILSI